MSIVVKGKHMHVPEDVREYAESKAEKLIRYLADIQNTEVTLATEADQPFVEIVVTAKKRNTFVATHRDHDMHVAMDQCFHKITEQLRRHKDKIRDRQGPQHGEADQPA